MSFAVPPVQSEAGLPDTARAELARALALLQSGGTLVRMAQGFAGMLGGLAAFRRFAAMPAAVALRRAAEVALESAFDVALLGLPRRTETGPPGRPWQQRLARLDEARVAQVAAAASGAVGGWMGLAGTLPDLAFTTLLIMRQIAAVATAEGEDLRDVAARRACLEVFALAGREPGSGYWSARVAFRGAPLAALLRQAAQAWGLAVSERVTAGAVPVIGAAGGMLVNTAFLGHYRRVARAHFTVRRLERQHGGAAVRRAATELRATL